MPNYILSRTSPPEHIYERKINLGYGLKVDTSDAPTPEPNKGKKMNDVKTLDVADKPVQPAVADGTVFVQNDGDYPVDPIDREINAFASASALEAEEAAEEKRKLS